MRQCGRVIDKSRAYVFPAEVASTARAGSRLVLWAGEVLVCVCVVGVSVSERGSVVDRRSRGGRAPRAEET